MAKASRPIKMVTVMMGILSMGKDKATVDFFGKMDNTFRVGEWYQNKKEGTGTWKSPKGDSYIGEWKDNKSNGFGVHIYSNGDRY